MQFLRGNQIGVVFLKSRQILIWKNLSVNKVCCGHRLNVTTAIENRMSVSHDEDNCWYPERIFTNQIPLQEHYAIMVLNRPISTPTDIVEKLWENALLRVCVDGGTNRWLNFIQHHCQGKNLKDPDLITGDFDSVAEDTLDYFRRKNCRVLHTPDQNETDFTKSLRGVATSVEGKQIKSIVVLQETSGRLDQIMANINTLFKGIALLPSVRIYLLSSNSMTWLLNPGKHSISIPSDLVECQRWCSIVPIGEKATVTTSGFKWDMTNSILEFGGLVSTSNTYASRLVKVQTTGYLLWTMGILKFGDT